MTEPKIEWHRCEFFVGETKRVSKPDDPWSARFQGWTLNVDPLRRHDLERRWGVVPRDPFEHIGWKWSVTPKDLTTHPSYSGTVPGVGAVGEAKFSAWTALKWGLAFEG